jgi:hypothetical protein
MLLSLGVLARVERVKARELAVTRPVKLWLS